MESKEGYLRRFEEFEKKKNKVPIHLEIEEFSGLEKIISEHSTNGPEFNYGIRKGRSLSLTSKGFDLSIRSDYIPNQTIVIERIAVTPVRSGIGSYILKWLVNYSKDKGFERVVLENCDTDDSLNFAQSKGFIKCYNPNIEWLQLDNIDDYFMDYQLFIK